MEQGSRCCPAGPGQTWRQSPCSHRRCQRRCPTQQWEGQSPCRPSEWCARVRQHMYTSDKCCIYAHAQLQGNAAAVLHSGTCGMQSGNHLRAKAADERGCRGAALQAARLLLLLLLLQRLRLHEGRLRGNRPTGGAGVAGQLGQQRAAGQGKAVREGAAVEGGLRAGGAGAGPG